MNDNLRALNRAAAREALASLELLCPKGLRGRSTGNQYADKQQENYSHV